MVLRQALYGIGQFAGFGSGAPQRCNRCTPRNDKLERRTCPIRTAKPDSLKAAFMFASPAYAQAAAGAAPAGMVGLLQFVPYIAIFAIFWFLMIRPQQQRAAEHRAMIDAVKKGDEVVTGGGLVGKVVRVMDSEVEIELAPQLKVKAVKATLADVRNRTAPVAANDVKG